MAWKIKYYGFTCPHCRQGTTVAQQRLSKLERVRCKSCKRWIVLYEEGVGKLYTLHPWKVPHGNLAGRLQLTDGSG